MSCVEYEADPLPFLSFPPSLPRSLQLAAKVNGIFVVDQPAGKPSPFCASGECSRRGVSREAALPPSRSWGCVVCARGGSCAVMIFFSAGCVNDHVLRETLVCSMDGCLKDPKGREHIKNNNGAKGKDRPPAPTGPASCASVRLVRVCCLWPTGSAVISPRCRCRCCCCCRCSLDPFACPLFLRATLSCSFCAWADRYSNSSLLAKYL